MPALVESIGKKYLPFFFSLLRKLSAQMRFIVSLILGISIATYTAYNIQQSTQPWLPKIMDKCLNPANHDGKSDLRVAYTGASTLDGIICLYVTFIQQPLHDIVGAPIMRLLMGAFGSAYAIMCFEGSRQGYKKSTLLAAFPLLGLLANLVGISLVFPALWVPLNVYYTRNKPTNKEGLSLSLPEVYGILASIVIGYGLPSAIIASPLIKNGSKVEEELLSIWQVLPIVIVPMFSFAESLFKKNGSPIDSVTEPALKKRLYVAEGKDALERSYLFLGILNMFLYFGCYLTLALEGIRIWDSLILLLRAPDHLPAGLTFSDLGHILGSRTMLVEYISLSISFVVWTILDTGFISGLAVALATPLIGPGAAISFYAYSRENLIQDISDAAEIERITKQE